MAKFIRNELPLSHFISKMPKIDLDPKKPRMNPKTEFLLQKTGKEIQTECRNQKRDVQTSNGGGKVSAREVP